MKKILVLGSSIAGVKAIEEIRRFERDSEAVILGLDGRYPYDHNLFVPVIAKDTDYKKIFYKPNDFYEQNRIRVILDQKIARVNLKKNRITTEDKQQLEYDILIIADAPGYRLPEIKGVNKNGVYAFKQLEEIDRILDILPLVDNVVVQSDGFAGLQIASAFLKRDKEVVWIVATENIFQEILDPEISRKIAGALEGNKLHIVCQNTITDILGEGEVKAIRLKTGKVLAAQMVILPDAQPDFKLFADAPLAIGRRIAVDGQCSTGIEGVFAVDRAADGEGSADSLDRSSLEEQGKVVAGTINGQAPVFLWSDAQSPRVIQFPNLTLNFRDGKIALEMALDNAENH